MIFAIIGNVILMVLAIMYFVGLIMNKNKVFCVVNNESATMAKFGTYKEAKEFQQNKYFGYYKSCKIKEYYL